MFRPQALANFQLDRKLQGRAFLVPNDAVSTRLRQEYLPHQKYWPNGNPNKCLQHLLEENGSLSYWHANFQGPWLLQSA